MEIVSTVLKQACTFSVLLAITCLPYVLRNMETPFCHIRACSQIMMWLTYGNRQIKTKDMELTMWKNILGFVFNF